MSTSSINSRRRPPTHCQCGKPLARRVAWTNINPCRRFLNYRNSTNRGMPHCNSFYWIDPELPNEWYKSQLPQLYLTLNQEQRVHFLGQLSAQERLEIIQDEFEVYQNEMETEIKAMAFFFGSALNPTFFALDPTFSVLGSCSSTGALDADAMTWVCSAGFTGSVSLSTFQLP
nr:hypothetical protein [Tanacetum cinerariifolium]